MVTSSINGVPEPSTWVMMLAGFSALGGMLFGAEGKRSRRPERRRSDLHRKGGAFATGPSSSPINAKPPALHFRPARAGSTLLAALLRQNPRFSAGMSSPVYNLFRSMLAKTSARNEGAVFIDDDIRKRLLHRRVRRLLLRGRAGDGDLRHQSRLDDKAAGACRALSGGQADLLRAQSGMDSRQHREPHPPQRLRAFRASSTTIPAARSIRESRGLRPPPGCTAFP